MIGKMLSYILTNLPGTHMDILKSKELNPEEFGKTLLINQKEFIEPKMFEKS
jgi:hypothetical protein